MNCGMTRWKLDPSYPYPSSSPCAVTPVASALKFSTVIGTVLLVNINSHDPSRATQRDALHTHLPYRPITIRPIGRPPCSISK